MNFKKELKEKKTAATKIQSQYRGYRERKSFQEKKELLKKQKLSTKKEMNHKNVYAKERKEKETKERIKKDDKEKAIGKAKVEEPSKAVNLKPIERGQELKSQIPKPANPKLQPKPLTDSSSSQKLSQTLPKIPSKSQASEAILPQDINEKMEAMNSELQIKDRKIVELQENMKTLQQQLENTANLENGQDSFVKYQKIFIQEQKLAKEKELFLVSMLKNFELASKIPTHKEGSSNISKDKKEQWKRELLRRNQLVMEKHKHIQVFK